MSNSIFSWILGSPIEILWSYFINKFKNKNIILGNQGSGKTHLSNWLVYNKLLDEYLPTNSAVQIKNFLDYSGHYYDAKNWEEDIKDKDNIFYLFDLEKFLNKVLYTNEKQYDKVVITQISFFTEYLEKKGSMDNKKLIIVGTHLDKIGISQGQKIVNDLKNNIDLGKAKILLGSLNSEENAAKLEKEIKNLIEEL